MFGKKGQGSLEYLLLIGGAVLVAAIVIALVVSSGTSAGSTAKCNTAQALCTQKFPLQTACTGAISVSVQGTTYYCGWVAAQNLCTVVTASAGTTPQVC